jgi:hypothetical protein
LTDALTCWNGYWISGIPGSSKIVFDNEGAGVYEMNAEDDDRLCGNIVIGGIHDTGLPMSDPARPHTLLITGPVEVYGTVTVNPGGSIWFDPSTESSLTIHPHCQAYGWENGNGNGNGNNVPVPVTPPGTPITPGTPTTPTDVDADKFRNDRLQFILTAGAGIGIENADWDEEGLLSSGSYIRLMAGCANLDGDLWFHAINLPTKSNAFPLLETQDTADELCADQFEEDNVDHDLPGSSCTNLETWASTGQIENSRTSGTATLFAVTNYKHLCNWHIGLISAGVFVGAVAAAGIVALLAGGMPAMGGGGTTDYVAL